MRLWRLVAGGQLLSPCVKPRDKPARYRLILAELESNDRLACHGSTIPQGRIEAPQTGSLHRVGSEEDRGPIGGIQRMGVGHAALGEILRQLCAGAGRTPDF